MSPAIALTAEQFKEMKEAGFRANPPEVMDVPELSVYLGVGEDLIRARTQEGEIPSKKIGGRVLYYREAIRAWLGRKS